MKRSKKLHNKFQQLSRFLKLQLCNGRKGGLNTWNLEEEKTFFVRLLHLLLKTHRMNKSLEWNHTAAVLQFPTALLHWFFLDRDSFL